MHHLVYGINFLILSVSLASHVSTHLLIHLSAHLCHHHHSHHPSLLHSFTPGSKPTFSTNPSLLRLLLLWAAFTIMGPDWIYHASRSIFSSFFSFFSVSPGGLSRLHYMSAFYCTFNTQCRINIQPQRQGKENITQYSVTANVQPLQTACSADEVTL